MNQTASSAPWGRYEYLLPAEIETISARHPIAYLPWGALEYHGAHAAVGLDGLKAHALCCALAQSAGGLVLPPVYVAANTIKGVPDLPHRRHSLDFRETTLRLLVREHLDQLADEKFRLIFVLCGHVGQPHYDIIRDEVRQFNARTPSSRAIATSETDLLPPDLVVVNHAALGEISLLLHSHPECVDLGRLPADRVPTLAQDAVWGPDPRAATAEQGSLYSAAFVTAAHQLITTTRAQIPD